MHLNFTDPGIETCTCGFVGLVYAFGTVNGVRACVRCHGSKEATAKKLPTGAAARGAKRGAAATRLRRRGSRPDAR